MKAKKHTDFEDNVSWALEQIAREVIWSVDGGDPTGINLYLTTEHIEEFLREDEEMVCEEDRCLSAWRRQDVRDALWETKADVILF